MKVTKVQKKELSEKLAEELKQSRGIFFASYQGLRFQNLADLRSRLSSSNCRFRVVRNAIMSNAAKGAGIGASDAALFKGPLAVAIQKEGDIVSAAKVLSAFEKEFPALKLKACYSDKVWYNQNECKRLASLASRPELLGSLAGTLYGSVSQIASVLQAPMRDLAYALKAVGDKKGAAAA
ncbi:MAG: 50S ribosomal protein L10 [Elusimicrobia bacterium]|nr:50S ribosomal protein L10 [Elusimicrobiota bacterium]